eukprot:364503-Chlamydomonas_euryale.AAC.16
MHAICLTDCPERLRNFRCTAHSTASACPHLVCTSACPHAHAQPAHVHAHMHGQRMPVPRVHNHHMPMRTCMASAC